MSGTVIHGTAQRLVPAVHLAETTPGEARFKWFAAGLPEMDDQDWRQFEITSENARRMVDTANAAIGSGSEMWVNYGHDAGGARAGDVVRFELGLDGGVYGVVRWNATARAAIKQDPPEWKYFSPEFFVKQVTDAGGNPKFVGGKQLLQPFEISGGALTNTPAMKKLSVAASSTDKPNRTATPARAEEELPAVIRAVAATIKTGSMSRATAMRTLWGRGRELPPAKLAEAASALSRLSGVTFAEAAVCLTGKEA